MKRHLQLALACLVVATASGCSGGGSNSQFAPNGFQRGLQSTTSYPTTVLADQPIAYYRLNETSGTTLSDSAPQPVNGTLGSRTTVQLGQPALSQQGYSAFFVGGGSAGVTHGVRVPYNAKLQIPQAITVEAWYKPQAASQYYTTIVSGSDHQGAVDGAYELLIDGSRFAFTLSSVGGSAISVESTSNYVNGAIYHIVGKYNGSSVCIYVNGVKQNSCVTASGALGNYSTTSGLGIGSPASNYGNGNANGYISDVALYRYALTDAQITNHYASGTGGSVALPASYSALVLNDAAKAYYRLGETSGTTMTDSAPSPANGTYGAQVTLNNGSLISGDANPSASFPGSGSSAAAYGSRVAHQSKLEPQYALTVEAWVKSPYIASQYQRALVIEGDTSSNPDGAYGLQIRDSQFAFVLPVTGGSSAILLSPGSYSQATIYHLVGTYDGSTARFYVNGTLAASQSLPGTISGYSGGGLGIGTGFSNSGRAAASAFIDEVAVYDYALTPTQIANHYAYGNASAQPSPSAPPFTQAHTLTFDTIRGLTVNDGSNTINRADTQQNWNTLGKYLSLDESYQVGLNNAPVAAYAHNAGISVGTYTDIRFVCSGTDCGGPQGNTLADSAFVHNICGSTGTVHRLYDYNSSASPPQEKLIGDPSSTTLNSAWNTLIDSNSNSAGAGNLSFVFDDDVSVMPGDPYWITELHVGAPNGPVVGSPPYCNYTDASWLQAVAASEAAAHKPVIFNGLTSPTFANALLGTANVLGGMCEGCFAGDFGMNQRLGSFWQNNENAAISAVNQHKYFVDYAHFTNSMVSGVPTTSAQQYVYGSLMLSYSPQYTVFESDGNAPSGVSISPLTLLVPTQPIQTAQSNISELLSSTGAYIREFNACYINATLVGRCAAIVNSGSSNVSFPTLTNQYSHTITESGFGVVQEWGDVGQITALGSAPPATIGSGTAVIAFQ